MATGYSRNSVNDATERVLNSGTGTTSTPNITNGDTALREGAYRTGTTWVGSPYGDGDPKNEGWLRVHPATSASVLQSHTPITGGGSVERTRTGTTWGTWTGVVPGTHSHSIAQVSGLQAELDGKAPTAHTHTTAQVTGLDTALAAKAPLASPALTGVPTAPTAAAATNNTQLATTAFVKTSSAPLSHTHTTAQVTGLDSALAAKAPLASPALTGTPTAPTAAVATNTTQVATTAFVKSQSGQLAPAAHTHTTAQVTGLDAALAGKAPTSHTHTTAQVTGLDTALAAKAPLASPALTGVPTAPTAGATVNNTQLATTAFAQTRIAQRVVYHATSAAALAASSGDAGFGLHTAPEGT